jgi:hypothetical protein
MSRASRFAPLFALLAAVPSLDAQGVGVAVHAGTLGLGADVGIAVHPRIGLRAGANFMPVKPDFTISDIRYSVSVPSPQFTGAVDLFLVGPLRLTGGLRVSASDFTVEADLSGSSETVDVGDTTYTGADVGVLTGTLESNQFAPYAGIGIGRVGGSRLGFFLDLGVAFTGEPSVAFTSDGSINNDPLAGPVFRAELNREAAQVEDESLLKYYPILSVGLSFGFSTGAR